jgi:hypothetical protein
MRQINNLVTGTRLAAEIPASSESRRAFLVVGAYRDDPMRPDSVSRFLNADHRSDQFWLRTFEIDRDHIGRPDSDDFIHELADQEGISTIEELERLLSQYLNDLSALDVHWRLDYPV